MVGREEAVRGLEAYDAADSHAHADSCTSDSGDKVAMGDEQHTPENWVAELKAAGWKQEMPSVWRCPAGYLFRGPYKAWEMMHAHPELSGPRVAPLDSLDKKKAKRR